MVFIHHGPCMLINIIIDVCVITYVCDNMLMDESIFYFQFYMKNSACLNLNSYLGIQEHSEIRKEHKPDELFI